MNNKKKQTNKQKQSRKNLSWNEAKEKQLGKDLKQQHKLNPQHQSLNKEKN